MKRLLILLVLFFSGCAFAKTPVAHWKLGDPNGQTVIRDSVGSNNGEWVGTDSNTITPASSPAGGGMVFDGVDDKITVPADPSIDAFGKTALSISACIKPLGGGEGGLGRVIDKIDPGGLGYRIQVSSGGVGIRADIFHVSPAANAATAINSNVLTVGAWNHVAFVFNEDSNKKIKLYVNGVLQSLTTNTAGVGTIPDDSAVDLAIGNLSADTSKTFDGSISDVRIYDTALKASDVKAIFTEHRRPKRGFWGRMRDRFL